MNREEESKRRRGGGLRKMERRRPEKNTFVFARGGYQMLEKMILVKYPFFFLVVRGEIL